MPSFSRQPVKQESHLVHCLSPESSQHLAQSRWSLKGMCLQPPVSRDSLTFQGTIFRTASRWHQGYCQSRLAGLWCGSGLMVDRQGPPAVCWGHIHCSHSQLCPSRLPSQPAGRGASRSEESQVGVIPSMIIACLGTGQDAG